MLGEQSVAPGEHPRQLHGTIPPPRSYIAHMRVRLALLISLMFVAGSLGRASDLALTGAKIYLSPTDPPIENGSILIRDGHILAVGPSSIIKIPRAARVIDGKGLVVTAGFWNNHVHILPPALLHARDTRAKELDQQLETMFNRWGFTTVFDISSVLDNTFALRRRIEASELRGPRVLTVGEPIWTVEPVYVRDFLEQNHIHIPNTQTPEQAIALVRDHAAKGAGGIKLFACSDQGQGKAAVLPLAVAKAAVEEAHRHNMPVFVHPSTEEGVLIAVNSGADILAHTVPQSPPWTPDFVSRLKQANLSLIPTLTLFDFETRKWNGPDREREAWISQMVDQLRAYSQAGGDVLFGTDIGYTDHYDTTLEFTLMSQAGMSYLQILASLTTNPARKFRDSGRTGRIAKGMNADLVVLSADPAQDVTAFSKVHYTIRNGKVIYQEK
jgi:imidazolonepropionase-like amidohydrolase